ncbi:MAG: DUF429 domain-containing protein [Caldimicrobium sp.]
MDFLKDREKVLGLDLAGSLKNKTGYAYFKKGNFYVGYLYEDDEILHLCQNFQIVMIDAPLSLPADRRSIEDRGSHLRECDKLLLKRGHKFFPITLGPMRKLTERGMRFKGLLSSLGIKVFETFPGAIYDLLGLPRKDKEAILKFYLSLNLGLEKREYFQDELDAIACWLAGVCYLKGQSYSFSGSDGEIVVATKACLDELTKGCSANS